MLRTTSWGESIPDMTWDTASTLTHRGIHNWTFCTSASPETRNCQRLKTCYRVAAAMCIADLNRHFGLVTPSKMLVPVAARFRISVNLTFPVMRDRQRLLPSWPSSLATLNCSQVSRASNARKGCTHVFDLTPLVVQSPTSA